MLVLRDVFSVNTVVSYSTVFQLVFTRNVIQEICVVLWPNPEFVFHAMILVEDLVLG